nr:voltage-dependent T-type calcium channel subunit alpha-1I-like [Nothobranchius furzeri]
MYSPIGEEPQHLRVINIGCICFFIFDMVLKMASLGIWGERGHLRSFWNRVELLVLIIEIVDCILFWSQIHWRISYPLKVVRLMIRVRGKLMMEHRRTFVCHHSNTILHF